MSDEDIIANMKHCCSCGKMHRVDNKCKFEPLTELEILTGLAQGQNRIITELTKERDELKQDLALNATMLARQCDLAREAEIGHVSNPDRKEEEMWKKYIRKGVAEMRPYVLGEDLSGVSVSAVDKPKTDMGMIARNPLNHTDQWYVAKKYFEENFVEQP